MIVNYSEDGWQIVTQRAHGILAAAIGLHWKIKDRPARWLETLLAIAEHDDAEIELDGEDLITETGGPISYSMKTFDLEHCRKLERMMVTKSRYISLLTSMHMEFLYGKEKSTNGPARSFLNEQKKNREQTIKEIGIKKQDLETIYNFMEWCDAFSLLLCEQQIQGEKRMTEISTGPDREPYQVFKLKENQLTVEPWPFQESRFLVSFERRTVNKLSFKSSAEFRTHFLAAPVETVEWEIRKKPANWRAPDKVHR